MTDTWILLHDEQLNSSRDAALNTTGVYGGIHYVRGCRRELHFERVQQLPRNFDYRYSTATLLKSASTQVLQGLRYEGLRLD